MFLQPQVMASITALTVNQRNRAIRSKLQIVASGKAGILVN